LFTPLQHRLFRKDIDRDKNSGKYKKADFEILKNVMQDLVESKPLDQKFQDHSLEFEWIGYRECHVKPDWLLVYKVIVSEEQIIFVRLGMHTQIFSSF
jgi:mRNA interferase YafQ